LFKYLDCFSTITALLVPLSMHTQGQQMRKNFSGHKNASIKQS